MIAFLKTQRAMTGAVFALAIKASGALLMISVFTLAARSMSTTAFGELAMWFNALSCLAVIAVFGQETLIVRSWGEYSEQGDFGLMKGAYRFGWTIATLCAAIACAVLAFANRLLPAPLSALALLSACAFLAAQTLLHYSSHSCRTICGFRISEPHRELTWRIVLLAAVASHLHGDLRLAAFFFAAAAGMALSIAFQSIAVKQGFPVGTAAERSTYKKREWLGRGAAMGVSASVEALSQYAEVIILGFLATPSAAAGYFIAARIANIFSMLSTGLNTYTVTTASNLHFGGQTERLQHVMRSVMTVAFALVTPLFIILILIGGPILSVFGPSYLAAHSALVILTTASFIITLSGPSSGLLLITGDENLWSRVAALSLVLRILIMSRLAPEYGAAGAALSWAIVNIPVAIAAAVLCRQRCGVDPSAFALLSYWRKRPALSEPEASRF
ncbi:MAG TPA: lipopolysaccharide biosynthesis protein [Roseiarcus sp.]|nr:lipopolysaccharide biosynthesis protein [Roseiarcus sp.]